jgi:dTDP-4-dehydrorhamnose 3,5-epimerase-like enzyme
MPSNKISLFKNSDAYTCQLTSHKDHRGSLSFAQYGKDLPFVAQRFFWIYEVPQNTSRGGHAHHKDHQFLICFQGAVTVEVIHNTDNVVIVLDSSNLGLYLPPLTWNNLLKFSPNSILGVLSSNQFDQSDYIEDMDQYLRLFKHG